MKRYPTIDFLRGVAISIMLCLHMVLHVLDIDTLVGMLSDVAALNLILLITLPFLGGLAGFFLLVSAMGNAVSMQKYLQKGKSVASLAGRQIIGGLLVLFFAMLSEGLTGYHGTFANYWKNLDQFPITFTQEQIFSDMSRMYHFETIHTIAWCIIINGALHALISAKGRWQQPKKVIKIYIILIVVVLALTPVVWYLVDLLIPGYPYVINPLTGKQWMYPLPGVSPFKDFVLTFFLNPLAGKPEPIFPYLASSFMGTIIAVVITEDREKIGKKFPHRMIAIGAIMFLVGFIGTVLNIVLIMMDDFDQALNVYQAIWEHRRWTSPTSYESSGWPENGVPIAGWLFQYLLLNGFGICGTMLVFRLVEWRGRAKVFAKKTEFIRRFGFIAFTMYNSQWLYYGIHYFVSTRMGVEPYQEFMWKNTLVVVGLGILTFWAMAALWEKIGYVGSIEWWISILSLVFVPARRKAFKENRKNMNKWYLKVGGLDIDGAFYNAEWINVINRDEMDHENLVDSRLSAKLGVISLLFFPAGFMGLGVGLSSRKTEGKNKFNKRGIILCAISLCIALGVTIFLLSVSLSDFGIAL